MITVTACTTMGHLLDMNHSPESLQSAQRWARELVSMPCIRHVVITETSDVVLDTVFAAVKPEIVRVMPLAEARIVELETALADLQEYICAGGASNAEHDAMMARVDRLLERHK